MKQLELFFHTVRAPLPPPDDGPTVALIGCSATKATSAAPARELYQGMLFRKALAYAARTAAGIYILSARHGLVHPDEVLEPYDDTLAGARLALRRAWGARVGRQLVERVPRPAALQVLAGRAYREHIPPDVLDLYTVTAPLEGLGIGEQLSWLTEALADLDEPEGAAEGTPSAEG